MKFRCWIGLHRWSPWNDPHRATVDAKDRFGEDIVIQVFAQTRRCYDCNKARLRRVSTEMYS